MTEVRAAPVATVVIRQFTWGIAGILGGIVGIAIPWATHGPFLLWPLLAALLVLLWGYTAPRSVEPVYRAVMRVAHPIGVFNNRVLLTAVFLIFFVPVGIVRRMLRKDPLDRRFDPEAATYRIPRDRDKKPRLDRPY